MITSVRFQSTRVVVVKSIQPDTLHDLRADGFYVTVAIFRLALLFSSFSKSLSNVEMFFTQHLSPRVFNSTTSADFDLILRKSGVAVARLFCLRAKFH